MATRFITTTIPHAGSTINRSTADNCSVVVRSDHGIQSMTIEEEYGLAVLQEAQAICVAKNVKVRPNEFILPARTVFNLADPNSGFEGLTDVKIFDDAAPINVLD